MTKLPTIKFQHAYNKLMENGKPIENAKLVEVVFVLLQNLSRPFLDYDTDKGKYSLPAQGGYLMLMFQKPNGDLFTTLRPAYGPRNMPDKEAYYRSMIGKVFNVCISAKEVSNGV